MASTIKLKNGSGAPTTGDLVQGEPALDLTNKRLYTENASGVVIEVGTNPSTIDINAGTIDGTVIGGSTAAAITGTTITGTSFVSSGDMTFEDNDKAVFGDGSDLRIYHTGSHSTIENIGTGHLQIHTTDFRLRNSAGTESMILANADGNVQLFYDNAEKLATTATGIDVTGTVTADGLTVDGGSISGAYAVITNTEGTAKFGTDSNYARVLDGSNNTLMAQSNAESYYYNNGVKVLKTASGGDISFFEDTGTTAKFFWDASEERLGIGTTSPSVDLDVEGTAQVNLLEVTHDADRAVNFVKTGANTFSIEHDVNQFYFWNQTTSESPLLFQNDGDVIINGGNVGIGTSSPSNTLDLRKDTPAFSQTSSSGAYYTTLGTNVDYTKSFVLNNKGSEIITYGDDTGYGLNLNGGASNLIRFTTNATERMRIDSSGHLLVGTTNASNSVAGFRAYSGGNGAFTIAGQPLELNRLSSDGSILGFQKDGAPVGSIGSRSGVVSYIVLDPRGNGAGLTGNTNEILPVTEAGALVSDTKSLGSSAWKFKDLYLSGGVYLGGTGAANLLDDYEEGTWTPAFTNIGTGTYGVQLGRYTKVGNLVTATFHLDIDTLGSASGGLIVGGLPFTSVNVGNNYGSCTTTYASEWDAGYMNLGGLVTANAAYLVVYYQNASGTMTAATHANMQTGNFLGTIIYEAT
jgi:hypothetical protein